MVEIEKSQKEVWEWKEKVSEEVKRLSSHEITKFFEKVVDNFQKKYNLNLTTYKPLAVAK